MLLALSLIVAFGSFGPVQGAIAWIGQLCISAVVLVILMSWNSSAALKLGAVTIIVAFGLALLIGGDR